MSKKVYLGVVGLGNWRIEGDKLLGRKIKAAKLHQPQNGARN